jgi:hypothetical protein
MFWTTSLRYEHSEVGIGKLKNQSIINFLDCFAEAGILDLQYKYAFYLPVLNIALKIKWQTVLFFLIFANTFGN